MILPAALPATPALSSAAPVLAETPEVGAEFAALLGPMLEAGTGEHVAIPGTPATPTPITPPTTGNPDGNPLPDELPPLPATVDAETPESDVLSAIIPVVLPIAALTTLPPITPPAEVTADTQDIPAQRHAVAVPQLPVRLAEGGKAESPPSTQLQQPRADQAPVPTAAIPRLALPTAEDQVRTASPAPARIALTPIEGTTASMPTAQPLTFAVPEASASSSVTTAPASMRPQASHDFATLVDRLVEARDTARAAQAPQTVSASLAHAQFGDIAIRFEHSGGTALTVALSNPDPEFARAVQAAAPTAQASDSGAAPGRQDTTGQQAGNSSGQSPQSQAQQRGSGSLARNAAPHADGRDEQQPGRSGIFA